MTEVGVIGRVIDVRSTTIHVALNVGSKGFTKVGPNGLQTVGVVNSYITVPTGAHRVVAIVSGVYISGQQEQKGKSPIISRDDTATYELEAIIVGRFEGDSFKSGLTGYPPLHAPVQAATPSEVKNIFLPKGGPALRIGTSAIAIEQAVHLDANLLLGHHCAVVGSTGSGKSCTVMAIIDGLLDQGIPSGHIVIIDINGEYAQSFGNGTARGLTTRTVVLGPDVHPHAGLFLPHWFMNNEESLSLFRASEGVQAPVLQRSIADARAVSSSTKHDTARLQVIQSTISIIEQLYDDEKNSEQPSERQLSSMRQLLSKQATAGSPCQKQWAAMLELVDSAYEAAQLKSDPRGWSLLTPTQKDILSNLFQELRTQISDAFDILGIGSAEAAPDFDAPVYYSLQQLCDFFLPNRIKLEQANDNKIAGYVATLQMRLSRLLADGRYDFMTRVEQHHDPLGSYLRLLMGVDPTGSSESSDWPAANLYRAQAKTHVGGPSVTIFDLSLVASDVLENVTSLLGRLLFDFAVRSDPRAEHPVLLVLEEAHRFVPARREFGGTSTRSTAVFERIAKEGRKFGISLLLASQRPSELSETVLAQCGTVIAHRLTHEADQGLLRHATALSSRGLLDQLPSLAQQHALITGVSIGVPVAVRVRDVESPPKSNDPDFINAWRDERRIADLPGHIDRVVREWQGGAS